MVTVPKVYLSCWVYGFVENRKAHKEYSLFLFSPNPYLHLEEAFDTLLLSNL